MRDPETTIPTALREDIVVSVCFSDLRPDKRTLRALGDLAARLDEVYRFREIILVVESSEAEAFMPIIAQVSDVRLFVVGTATDFYERRVIAAEEAIGDLVLLGAADELEHIDILAFLDHTGRVNATTLATRQKHSRLTLALTAPIIAIGRIAGFKVNMNDLQTIAMPRTLLNTMLRHEEPRLALRFPPRDPRTPFNCLRVDGSRIARSRITGLPRRVQMLNTLLIYLAPVVLSIVSISSTLLTLLGLVYAAYIVGAWFLIENLAPGWLTTSAMLTLSAVFMGISTLGLSLGMQHLLQQHGARRGPRMAEEVNRIDLFGKVALDLNVEHTGRGEDP